jgi:hypothetical protein
MARLFNQAMELLGISPTITGSNQQPPATNTMQMPPTQGVPMPAKPAIPSQTSAPAQPVGV